MIGKDVLHRDASRFNFELGALGMGSLLGAIGLFAVDPGRYLRRISTGFAASLGLIAALAALDHRHRGLPALLVLAGLSMKASSNSANSILQKTANPRLRVKTGFS